MDTSFALETVTVSVALFCVALVPFAIGRDPGLARCIVQMDSLPRARWPNLLTRAGMACVLMSFALLLVGCYYIIAGRRPLTSPAAAHAAATGRAPIARRSIRGCFISRLIPIR